MRREAKAAAGLCLVVAVSAACSGYNSRSGLYAACKDAVYHDPLGLQGDRNAVAWPSNRSPSVTYVRQNGKYTITIRHVTVGVNEAHPFNVVIDCTVTRKPNGDWKAVASVES